MHLGRAEPLLSISDREYFVSRIGEAEAAWRLSCVRRRALAQALTRFAAVAPEMRGDRLSITRTLTSLSSDGAVEAEGGAGKPKYVPHAMTARVTRASTVNTMAEEDLEALSGDAPPALDAVVE